ncbi:hypothetical protein ID866_12612 [Astraeus odoratus]|nr:hypothetical protein ID866_12612 [Astraeus odoratus]
MLPNTGTPHPLNSEEQLNCILDVISASWTEKTKESYRAGLLAFHVFYDMNSIKEQHQAPVSQALLSAFISSCAGSYSGLALNNYIAGLHAWHLLHSIPWNIKSNELQSILEGASQLAPPSSKKPKWLPCKKDTLLHLLTYLNLEDARDAAIYACITVTVIFVHSGIRLCAHVHTPGKVPQL